MKATWEKIEKNVGVLDIEVGEQQVTEALDKAFKKVSAKLNVPGFRKGKVPRPIFEAKFGVESLYQDALDIILPEAYMAAVQETGIEPVDRPEVDIEQFAKGQTLKFKAKVMVKPEVTLGDYKGISVERPAATVSAEDVEAELKRMQERHAELVVVEEGAAQNGDITVIDFEGSVDGVNFEGGTAERYSLELGSGSFIPGFEDGVVGMELGDTKDIEVSFPENYHSEELKGKAAIFKVKLHEIKRKNLPVLDDEFAKDVSEFDSLDEYKKDIEANLLKRSEQQAARELENLVVEQAAAQAQVEIPEVMIETEIDQMVEEFGNRLRAQGLTVDLYYQFSGQDEAALRAQMRDDAAKRVRNNLVLDAISEKEGITLSEEELDAELNTLAQGYGRTAEELRSIFASNGHLANLRNDLKVKKTVDLLVANIK